MIPTYVYVASSWRNPFQPAIASVLASVGIPHYDFRNPPNDSGFGWEQVMPTFSLGDSKVTREAYLEGIQHERATEGFAADFEALQRASHVVLVLPCNRSAHLELGWAVGAGKQTAVLLMENPMEPELMYRMVDALLPSVVDLLAWLGVEN